MRIELTLLRLLGLIVILLLAPIASSEPANSPPDPSRLTINWWDYFVVAEEDDPSVFAQHIDTTSIQLSELKAQFESQDQSTLAALADTVINNLKRYEAFSAQPQPTPKLSRTAQKKYTLTEMRSLLEDLRKTSVKQEEETEELARLQQAIDVGLKELNKRRVYYRTLEETAPDRVLQGLQLMQAKLQLELGKLELVWRKANRKLLQQETDNLTGLVEAGAQRLTATDDAIAAAAIARSGAVAQGEAFKLKLLQAQLSQSGTLALTPVEQARERLGEQRMLGLGAQAMLQDIVAAENALVETVLQRVKAMNATDPGLDREYLGAYREELAQAKEQVLQWRAETARSREMALSSITDATDPERLKLLQQRSTIADSNERNLRAIEEQLIRASQFGDVLDSQLAQREGSVTKGRLAAEKMAGASWGQILQLAKTSLFEIGGTPVTSTDILRMLIILILAWWISKLLRRALQGIAEKQDSLNSGSIYTLSRILHYIILAVGIMIALSSIGIDFTKFALFASALGVGIGFGLQTLVSNFVAGLIILFEKSLKISDFVELESGVTGEVREINMRSTLVTTNDNIDIVVPNSEFVNGRVTNWTMREAFRRIHIPFGVAYGTDKELVRKAALEAAQEVSVTLTTNKEREPKLWFVEFGDSSLNFELVVWLQPHAVKSPGAVHARYLWEIDDKLRKYAIEVPFPQRDLHVRSVLGKIDIADMSTASGRSDTTE